MSKVKINREEDIQKYYISLNSVASMTIEGMEVSPFVLRVAANLGTIQKEIHKIRKRANAGNVNAPFLEKYEKARDALAQKHCKHDLNGKPIINNGLYEFDDEEAWEVLLEKLGESHKKAVELKNRLREEYENFLKEDIEVEIRMLDSKDQLPKNITPQQLIGLEFMCGFPLE